MDLNLMFLFVSVFTGFWSGVLTGQAWRQSSTIMFLVSIVAAGTVITFAITLPFYARYTYNGFAGYILHDIWAGLIITIFIFSCKNSESYAKYWPTTVFTVWFLCAITSIACAAIFSLCSLNNMTSCTGNYVKYFICSLAMFVIMIPIPKDPFKLYQF